MQRINVWKFAFAWGISMGIYLMVLGWMAATGWGIGVVNAIGSLYIGYNASFLGGIIGGVYAFVDWTIGVAIVGWIYNALLGTGR